MSRAVSPVSGKPYGVAAVCRVWRLARSGVYRHPSPPRSDTPPPRRRRPTGAMSDDALTAAIRAVLAAQPVPWRRPSQGLGTAATCRNPDLVAAGASVDARE